MTAAAWEADTVRDQLRDYVVEHLGEPDGVLLLDEGSSKATWFAAIADVTGSALTT